MLMETTNSTPIEVALKMDKDGFVRAKNLYEFLGLDKSNYSRWCNKNILENIFAEKDVDYFPFVLRDERNPKPTTDYKLTAAFAKKLAMISGSARGEEVRCYFIACEETLVRVAQERRQWEIERAKGMLVRHILTDTIKLKIADSPHKKFAYPNYTKLIYKSLFGKPLKQLQEEYHVKPKESIREYLTAEQLKDVESLEMLVSGLINCGWGYDQIKGFLETNHLKQMAG